MSDDVKSKIAKLLALAANNPNAEEADSAYQKAQKLMMKHDLNEADVSGTDAKEAPGRQMSRSPFMPIRGKHEIFLGIAASKIGGTMVLSHGTKQTYFVGRKDSVDITLAFYEHFQEQLERLYKRDLPKGMTKAERSRFRATYKQSAAASLSSRINRMSSHSDVVLWGQEVHKRAETYLGFEIKTKTIQAANTDHLARVLGSRASSEIEIKAKTRG